MIDPIAETRQETLHARAEAAYAAQEYRRTAAQFDGLSLAELGEIAASRPATWRGLDACKVLEVRRAAADEAAYDALSDEQKASYQAACRESNARAHAVYMKRRV
jgi:hypothetical protein